PDLRMFSAVHCATVGGMAVVLLTRPGLFVWQLYKDPSHVKIKTPDFYSHGANLSRLLCLLIDSQFPLRLKFPTFF
ncbi:MAG: hypothetical protein DRG71_09940, partial [Deltaproteobacteria bacterium]